MQAAASDRTSTWPLRFPAGEPHVFGIEWNAENQLKRVLKNAVEQARFAYDAWGRRVERVAGGTTTLWTYDGEDVIRDNVGGTATKYIHGPGTDEPLAQEDVAAALSGLHADALGSVLRTTNAAGVVISSQRYDAFGALEVGATNGYAFTGREWESAAGYAFYRARYYDPRIGRFISEDPIGLTGGLNLYAYVSNNPVDLIDPTGHGLWSCVKCAYYTRKCMMSKTPCIQNAMKEDPVEVMSRNNTGMMSDALMRECVQSDPDCGEAVESCVMCNTPIVARTPAGAARGLGVGALWNACKKLFSRPEPEPPPPGQPSPSPSPD